MVNVIIKAFDLNNQCGALPCEYAKNATLKGQSKNLDSQTNRVVGKPGSVESAKKKESKSGMLNLSSVSGRNTRAQKEKKSGRKQDSMLRNGKWDLVEKNIMQMPCIITTGCKKQHSMPMAGIDVIAAEKQNPYFSPSTTLIMTGIRTVKKFNLRVMAFTSGSSGMDTQKDSKSYA